MNLIYDIKNSHGNFLVDKITNKKFLDAFSFFASNPLGFNHPKLNDKKFEEKLLKVAKVNPSNADILTEEYVEFLEKFFEIAVPPYFRDSFFIAGGCLAVENALKTAFDWKYKKLQSRGIKINYNDMKVVHFKNAFHGRSGYTLTITNTNDPRKYDLFPQFSNWPRLTAPAIHERISEGEQMVRDAKFLNSALDIIDRYGNECCAIIIEPIQGEGGDNHFTKDFHKNLRFIADKNEMLLIHDEVQTGIGITGKMWAHEHYGIHPDILCFGKKMQVCGILSGNRVREVKGNVFEESSRINSTWGGNLVDMVRAQKYLEIIKEERLVQNSKVVGEYLFNGLKKMGLDNVRGEGLMCAFDYIDESERNSLLKRCFSSGLLMLGCGSNSVRVRPSLTFSKSDCDILLNILSKII